MTPTPRGSGDAQPDPERTDVLSQRKPVNPPPSNVDPDKTVVIAPSHGAPDERTTPVRPPVPAMPPYPSPPTGYPVGGYDQRLGQYGAPPAPMPAARRKRGWLWPLLAVSAIGLSALALLLVLVGGPLKSLTADKLDMTATQAGVRNVLTDPTSGYGLADVKDVTCNHGVDPTIAKGTTFTCDLTISGHPAQVTVRFLDDDGTYSVGRPE
jgi:hypothetical protein